MRPPRLLALAVVAVLAPAVAGAAQWQFESAATLTAQSETNPRLRGDSRSEVTGGSANAQFGLERRTEISSLGVDARLHSRRYSNDIGLDRDEYQLDVDAGIAGERYQLAALAALGRDTTLTSELGTTGISQVNLRREVLNLSLAPTWLLSERLSAGTTMNWQKVHYLGSENLALVDYSYASAGVQAGFRASERTTASLVASFDRLDSDRSDQQTRDYFLLLQAVHNWSPALSMTAAIGPSWVRSAGVRDTGMRYSASVTHRGQYTTLSASAGRVAAPAGSGLLTRREDLALSISRQVTEFLELSASGGYQRSREIVPHFSFTANDVRYTRAELGLSWRFAENWRLGAAAGGARQHIRQIDDTGRNFSTRLHVAWSRSSDIG